MHRISSKILDQAITRLKKGESLTSIISDCPEKYRTEISELLAVANLAVSAPKTIIPQPIKRKLYLDYQPKESWLVSVTHVARFTFPAVLATLVLALTGTFSAAMSSLPGDKLFTLKRAVEETQIKMASDPQEKALLQLQIASQRLEDAQKVIAQNDGPEATKQAITELKQQTIIALNNVKDVVGDPDPGNTNLVSKAEKLAKDQTKLVAVADPGTAQKDIAKLENTVSDIKKLFATTNDQTQAALPVLDKIEVSGNIAAIKSASITIDDNKFEVDLKNVVVQDNDNKPLEFGDLALNDTVKVNGHIKGDSNIADTITLLLKAPVKAEEKKSDEKKPQPSVTPSPTPVIKEMPAPAKPTDTFTGFIPEGPASGQ